MLIGCAAGYKADTGHYIYLVCMSIIQQSMYTMVFLLIEKAGTADKAFLPTNTYQGESIINLLHSDMGEIYICFLSDLNT